MPITVDTGNRKRTSPNNGREQRTIWNTSGLHPNTL